jgi:ABC-type multidrug transport system fused ATPase/permease subunit
MSKDAEHSKTGVFRQIARLLRPYVGPRLPILGLAIGCGAITAMAQAATLTLLMPLWNQVLFPPSRVEEPTAAGNLLDVPFEFFRSWGKSQTTFEDPRIAVLTAVCLVALVMAVIGAATQAVFSLLSRKATYLMVVDLRVDIARHLMGLSLRYHEKRRFGDLLSRVSSDVTTILGAVSEGLRGLLLEPMMALGALVFAFIVAPGPATVAFITLPILLVPVSLLAKRVRKGSYKSHTSLGASIQTLTQMFIGVRTVKSFGGTEREIERYREENRHYLRTSMRMVKAIALSHGWTAFYSIAGVAVMIFVLGILKIEFSFFPDAGAMAVFILLVARMNNHVKTATRARTVVEEAIGASERILDLFAEPTDVVDTETPESLNGLGSGIRIENLTFSYPEGERPALSEIQLEIHPGETLALVGASGAGKSTLVDLLARFIDPDTGRTTVDGHDLRDVSIEEWTTQYALVGQVPFLFHSSIGENIAYGKPEATPTEIEAAARAAQIHDFIVSLPEGYATDVSDMGVRLSGGQRQRITIARALLKGAPLLLLDEATSALDSESEALVQRALDELRKDRTVVVIAHRLATIRGADRIAVLDEGRLVELGSHEELIARKGTYARLHSLQALGAGKPELSRR